METIQKNIKKVGKQAITTDKRNDNYIHSLL